MTHEEPQDQNGIEMRISRPNGKSYGYLITVTGADIRAEGRTLDEAYSNLAYALDVALREHAAHSAPEHIPPSA